MQNNKQQSRSPAAAQRNGRQLTPEQKRLIYQRRLQRQRIKRRKRNLMLIAIAVLIVAAVLIIALTVGGHEDKNTPMVLGTLEPVITVTPVPEPSVTPEPTPEATAEPAVVDPLTEPFVYDKAYVEAVNQKDTGPMIVPDYSAVDPEKRSIWPKTKEGYMPVLKSIKTEEKVIAITIDDCFQAENLRNIVQLALDYNGKLTIFPIGKNIANKNIGDVVKWAWENGMELENHTYHHTGLYHHDDETMANEIWQQNTALNKILGVNYKVHFFRPHGGDERDDQRVQAYINQIGYYAVVHWSQCGSTDSLDSLHSNLKPGQIYLFHTTNNDLSKLEDFIPYAVQNGYRLITLNEMFGLPDNETSDISTWNSETPMLERFHVTPVVMKKTCFSRAAAALQQRLIDLGYLNDKADGEFGKNTANAVSAFQKACGFEQTGKATAETQIKLFSDSAPRKN